MSRTLLAALILAGPCLAEPPPEAKVLQDTMHRIIDSAEPSVVCVLASRSDKYAALGEGPSAASTGKLGGFNPLKHHFGNAAQKELVKRLDLSNPETVPEVYGSGVVIDANGSVLTNFHNIDKATKIYVRLPGSGRGSYADILAADARSDLAVLRMQNPPPDLKAIPFGDGGKVRKGDWIVVVASPFSAGFRDVSPSASWGIVSNVRRALPGPSDEVKRAKPLAQYGTMIQTDSRLNQFASGGALLNLDGQMVGLTSSLAAKTGGEAAGGYAIPLDANVKKMVEVLKRGEEIEYGFLGVSVNPDARSEGRGVVIADVSPGMPAARAGMIGGDVVTAINGNPVREQEDLFLNVSAALAGSEAEIEFRRGNQTRTAKVRLSKSTHSEPVIASNKPPPVFGLRVDYLSLVQMDWAPPEGVIIREKEDGIQPGSAADKKLKEWADRARLIVLAVDGKPVPTPADFYREATGKPSITLDIMEAGRDGDSTRKKVTLP
jgi:serine protease Do